MEVTTQIKQSDDPPGIELESLKAEVLDLRARLLKLEEKTRLISIDEENGILRICNRNYLFAPSTPREEPEIFKGPYSMREL